MSGAHCPCDASVAFFPYNTFRGAPARTPLFSLVAGLFAPWDRIVVFVGSGNGGGYIWVGMWRILTRVYGDSTNDQSNRATS